MENEQEADAYPLQCVEFYQLPAIKNDNFLIESETKETFYQ